ncbi:hypothetical protein DIURU_002211 [Diutina rugosa]|uniref:Essential protein Yae1 N-terminal domain-containing protein n=1 Tax=Diutina rugosa TaxID=5481 RepID=A0A642UQQ7_DIURU|nr:uncharacterized protein DIURU_002211 [Diutina rugosa]KAA8903700.1 hypothetical protein DIURU_002211 [Diutina rugosa]
MTEDLDLESVLDLEDDAYQRGFAEGQAESRRENLIEGKQYGYQTGYQRFVIVGYLQALVEEWTKADTENKATSHIAKLKSLLDEITVANTEESAQLYEDNTRKARNKARVIASLLNDTGAVSDIDDMLKEVCGEISVQTDPNDMW